MGPTRCPSVTWARTRHPKESLVRGHSPRHWKHLDGSPSQGSAPGCGDVLVKLEWENPTGSVKDRMAHAVIARAGEAGSWT